MKNFTLQVKLTVFVFLISFSCFSQSTANYEISITTIWNATDHTSVPGNAHWSDLIGATHNTANEFVEIDQNATLGIKNVAETGNNSAITTEINDAITDGKADQLLQDGFSPFGAISSAGFTDISVDEDFPLITLVSMVAPSPDWFIAINSLTLRSGNEAVNNGWKDTFTMDVFAYDAGTDLGADYNSSNQPGGTGGVTLITGSPINGNRMGTITFTLNNVLGVDKVSSINNIKLFPNPTSGIFNISNIENIDLKTIEVINILGSITLQVNIHNLSFDNNLPLNLSDLKKGVYFLKLITTSGQSGIQKLIIE